MVFAIICILPLNAKEEAPEEVPAAPAAVVQVDAPAE